MVGPRCAQDTFQIELVNSGTLQTDPKHDMKTKTLASMLNKLTRPCFFLITMQCRQHSTMLFNGSIDLHHSPQQTAALHAHASQPPITKHIATLLVF